MTSKPTPRPATPEASADNWVNSRTTDEEMKRLTFDVPANLHRRIKVACAKKGVKMADDLRELLERHYPE
jgi:hypothetical protein